MDPGLKRIQEKLLSTWGQLETIWKDIGEDAQYIKKGKEKVERYTVELFEDMIAEAQGRKENLEAELEGLIAEIEQLAIDLSLDTNINADAKSKDRGRTLLEAQKSYLEIANDLRHQKNVRMERYNNVNNQVKIYSDELDEEPYTITFQGIPSDLQVAELERKLDHLKKEKDRRIILFKKYRKNLSLLFQYTERLPMSELERAVIDETSIPPSTLTFKALSLKTLDDAQQLERDLKQEIAMNLEDGDSTWEKIRSLWSRLSVEEELQMAFEKAHCKLQFSLDGKKEFTYRPSVLKGLHKELCRLEEEKRKNMQLFITQVREELKTLWTSQCFMNDVSDRFASSNYQSCTDFTEEDYISDLYTEELLEKHEAEVTFWKKFIMDNQKIIDGINKREEMFSQFKELDFKSDDPARLSNRGGALLKEEKERKMLVKKIPKLEADLKALSKKFETDLAFRIPKFLVYGQEISALIETEWAIFSEEKERRKELRKKDAAGGVGKTLMTTQMNARGTKRPGQTSGITTPKRARQTPGSTPTASRLITTPVSTTSQRSKGPSQTPKHVDNQSQCVFMPPSGPVCRSARTRVASTKSKIPSKAGKFGVRGTSKEQVAPVVPPTDVKSPVDSYSEFSDHLLCKSTLNSSAVSTVAKTRRALLTPSSENV